MKVFLSLFLYFGNNLKLKMEMNQIQVKKKKLKIWRQLVGERNLMIPGNFPPDFFPKSW